MSADNRPQVILNYEVGNKPWARGNHDLNSWFNYGFTDQTFKQYVQAEIDRRMTDTRRTKI